MADGLCMEEEDKDNMLEFKETPSEVSNKNSDYKFFFLFIDYFLCCKS
jgi:hypothetical protein